MKRLLSMLLGLLLPLSVPAVPLQDAYCRNISVQEGLRSNTVRHVVQDSCGFMWFGTDNGLSRYDGYEVRNFHIPRLGADQYVSAMYAEGGHIFVGTSSGVFLFDSSNETFMPFLQGHVTGQVNAITRDLDGNLWIATMGQGVVRYNPRTRHCKRFAFRSQGGRVAQVMADKDNRIWTITNWGSRAVCRLNKAKDEFVPVTFGSHKEWYGGLKMLQGSDGTLWIGTWENGLMRVGSDGSITCAVSPGADGVARHIHTLVEKSADCILLGCDDGIIQYNPISGTWAKMDLSNGEKHLLADKFVYSIFFDKEGGMWFGTYYSGVNYLSSTGSRFEAYGHGLNGYNGNVVSRFCEDDYGRVWIASDDAGLACCSVQSGRIVPYAGRDILSTYNVHGLCADGSRLWVGTYANGVVRMDMANGTLRKYTAADGLEGGSGYAIHKDRKGRLWVGTMRGVCLYDGRTDRFRTVYHTGTVIVDIDEDPQGDIWFSTQGAGLLRYAPLNRRWKQFRYSDKDKSLPSDHINGVEIDVNGKIWIATQNGLCQYDGASRRFKTVRLRLPSQELQGVLAYEGDLWLSTTQGLVRYTPGSDVRFYNRYDGLVSDQLLPNALLKASDGRVFLGGVKGFSTFYPHRIRTSGTAPKVTITGLEIFNREQKVGEGILSEALHLTRKIELSHRENMFSLRFSSLSYSSPEKNRYAYRLEGFDKDWIEAGSEHKATYTNMTAGTYTFRVKGTNNDGVWGAQEATLTIVVHPPFWWSLPAKIVYLSALLLLIYVYTHMKLKMAERRHLYAIRSFSEKKELEVREARLRFFTMIAHEIRTPVSLIIAPLEQLMRKPAHKGNEELGIIHRNAHRLLELVNQLLDFNKVQQQGGQVRFRFHNVRKLMEGVTVRFCPTLEQRGIDFTVSYPPDDFCAVIDDEALTKIISNLMTNAVKYTRDKVRMACEVDADKGLFRIAVEDNGAGIGRQEATNIFKPFYQAGDNKPGTGIGLSIVKTLVELHHGRVWVESEPGYGARFVAELPVCQENVPVAPPEASLPASVADGNEVAADRADAVSPVGEQKDERRVLVVEDDEDMLSFISAHFRKDYQVSAASSGVEALARLREHAFSLIVSDWMMPEMDGAELCRRVRADRNTSHIPFVMLTARTDDDSKTEGMECGADAYIEKPFSMKYLEACIRNLIDMRRQLMVRFANSPSEPISRIASSEIDGEFLKRMNSVIEENMDNPNLNVSFLAEKMNVSRSGLFAKIKSLTDVTPNEMIQVVRLRRAAILLRDGGYRINEVSVMVGFGSPSYFTKCFQKQFGMKPGDYMGSERDRRGDRMM